ncbi:hypothetical protein Q1695_009774 [Nippostrongylus brasiliensis]|nr:hypothetical protein Q1695_009774 [Nippostrongylus brasiliensis]
MLLTKDDLISLFLPYLTYIALQFVSSSALGRDGSVQKHTTPPAGIMVCPRQCTTVVFDGRDVLQDAVPQRAIYNNRLSSRWDGLYGAYGRR